MPRPKKSTQSKKLRGNPGKQNLDDSRIPNLPVVLDTEPPEFLTEKGREVWASIFPLLQGARLLTSLDIMTLSRYADLWAEYLDFIDSLVVFKGTPEYPQMYYAKQSVHKQLLVIEKEFGMTPASRERVRTVPTLGEKDEWEDF